MTEEEARSIMKARRWTYLLRKPRGVAEYVYAVRKKPRSNKLDEVYICPLLKLGELTEADLVAKLEQPPPAKKPRSAEREPEVSDTTDPLTPTDEL